MKFKLLPVAVFKKVSMKYLNCPWQVPKSGFACRGVEGGCFSFIHVEYNWHWSVTVTENCQAVRRQPQLHRRPVQWQKQTANTTVFGEPRQGSPSRRPAIATNCRRTATNKVSPTSATATYFEVKSGLIGDRDSESVAVFGDRDRFQSEGRPDRRPRQKSVAYFGDRDIFQNEGRPVSATATQKKRPQRFQNKGRPV